MPSFDRVATIRGVQDDISLHNIYHGVYYQVAFGEEMASLFWRGTEPDPITAEQLIADNTGDEVTFLGPIVSRITDGTDNANNSLANELDALLLLIREVPQHMIFDFDTPAITLHGLARADATFSFVFEPDTLKAAAGVSSAALSTVWTDGAKVRFAATNLAVYTAGEAWDDVFEFERETQRVWVRLADLNLISTVDIATGDVVRRRSIVVETPYNPDIDDGVTLSFEGRHYRIEGIAEIDRQRTQRITGTELL